MASLAKISIIGRLGRDPEMRYTPNGRPVTEFTVAVNQSTKNQQSGEWIEATDWFRVTIWGDRAERAAEQFRKGNQVFVEGRFRAREFEGKDGQKRTSLEISADSVINLEPRAARDEEGGGFGAPSGGFGGGSSAGGPSAGGPSAGGFGDAETVRPTRPAPAARPAPQRPSDDDLDDLPF
jgi:single-strand DNA-binding protein